MLEALEGEVSRALSGIQRGIEVLEARQATLRSGDAGAAGAGTDPHDVWYADEDPGGPIQPA